ncbi:MAG: hypothetical protein AAGJ28_06900 [Pseudomonadota bacterium]
MAYEVDTELIRRASVAAGKANSKGTLGVLLYLLNLIPWMALGAVITALTGILLQEYGLAAPDDAMLAGAAVGVLSVLAFIRLLIVLGARIAVSADDETNVEVTLRQAGVEVKTRNMSSAFAWAAINRVVTFKGGFGLRVGTLVYAIPETALPDGQSREDVIARIETWRETEAVFG